MDITINEAQRLFVIPCAGGYTCAGFDYVFRQLRVLAEKNPRHPKMRGLCGLGR